MTCDEIIERLKELEDRRNKMLLLKHGAKEPFYGVKIEDLKKVARKVKTNYAISMELYKTGISDAMFVAGLISDPAKMTREDLQSWVEGAYWYQLSEMPVAWTAAESKFGLELALQWIDSDKEFVADAGWIVLGNLAMMTPDNKLDLKLYKKLIERVVSTIQKSPNRVRFSMNQFVTYAGGYIPSLKTQALEAGMKIGKISVNIGGTATKVPEIKEVIGKMEQKDLLGKKKKHARV